MANVSSEPKVGDVVVLNSGGPAMTVVKADPGSDKVLCGWIDDAGDYDSVWLPPACVRAAPASGLGVG